MPRSSPEGGGSGGWTQLELTDVLCGQDLLFFLSQEDVIVFSATYIANTLTCIRFTVHKEVDHVLTFLGCVLYPEI